MQGADAIAQHEHRADIEQGVADHDRQRAEYQRLEVAAEQFGQRNASGLLGDCLEQGGFSEFESRIQADEHQHGANQKRNAPAPGHELFVAEQQSQQQKQTVGHEKADGGPKLGKHAEQTAAVLGRVFCGEQRRAAPFAAEPQPLADAQNDQQPRSQLADVVITGQQADERGAHAHREQRGDQGGLAAESIAEMSEQKGADRPRQKRDAESGKGVERLRRGRGAGKEHRPDDQRRSNGVNVEVVELDGRADEAGDGDMRCLVDRGDGRGCHRVSSCLFTSNLPEGANPACFRMQTALRSFLLAAFWQSQPPDRRCAGCDDGQRQQQPGQIEPPKPFSREHARSAAQTATIGQPGAGVCPAGAGDGQPLRGQPGETEQQQNPGEPGIEAEPQQHEGRTKRRAAPPRRRRLGTTLRIPPRFTLSQTIDAVLAV